MAVALVAVLRAVAVTMVMRVAVSMVAMVVPAAAGRALGMAVVLMIVRLMTVRLMAGMGMAVAVIAMAVMLMPMIVAVMVVAVAGVVAVGMVVILGALGLERAAHRVDGAALPADHLGQRRIVRDVDRVRRDLGGDMAAADLPGGAHQPQRVFGADLQQVLGRGPDPHEAAVFEPDRITVPQFGGLGEVEHDLEPAIARERNLAAGALGVVQRQGLDDRVRLDRSLAND